MSFFQWVIVVGLAAAVYLLFETVKAVLAVGQALDTVTRDEHSPSHALYRIEDRLTEIAEQAKRLADCYARTTHDPVEEAKAKASADLLASLRADKPEPASSEERKP